MYGLRNTADRLQRVIPQHLELSRSGQNYLRNSYEAYYLGEFRLIPAREVLTIELSPADGGATTLILYYRNIGLEILTNTVVMSDQDVDNAVLRLKKLIQAANQG